MCRACGVDENGNVQQGRRCPSQRGAARRRQQRALYQRKKTRAVRSETYDEPHTEMYDVSGDGAPATQGDGAGNVEQVCAELIASSPLSYADLDSLTDEELDAVVERNRVAYTALAQRQAEVWNSRAAKEKWHDVSRDGRDEAAGNEAKVEYLQAVTDTGSRIVESAEARLIQQVRSLGISVNDDELYPLLEKEAAASFRKERRENGFDEYSRVLDEAMVTVDGVEMTMREGLASEGAFFAEGSPEAMASAFAHVADPCVLGARGYWDDSTLVLIERAHKAAKDGDMSFFANRSNWSKLWGVMLYQAMTGAEELDNRNAGARARDKLDERDEQVQKLRAEILADEVQRAYGERGNWGGGHVIRASSPGGKPKKMKALVEEVAGIFPATLIEDVRERLPMLTTKTTSGKRTLGYFSTSVAGTVQSTGHRVFQPFSPDSSAPHGPALQSEIGIEDATPQFYNGLPGDTEENRRRVQELVDEFNARDDYASADEKGRFLGSYDATGKPVIEMCEVETPLGTKKLGVRAVDAEKVKRRVSSPVLAFQPDDPRVAIHELSHAVEHSNEAFFAAGEAFLAKRTAGKGGKTTREVADGFYRDYVGHLYTEDSSATEVMSTGMEDLAASGTTASLGRPWSSMSKVTPDPEHAAVVIGALAGANYI